MVATERKIQQPTILFEEHPEKGIERLLGEVEQDPGQVPVEETNLDGKEQRPVQDEQAGVSGDFETTDFSKSSVGVEKDIGSEKRMSASSKKNPRRKINKEKKRKERGHSSTHILSNR